MIIEQRRAFPQYGWRSQDATSFWLDKLTGNQAVRLAIEAGEDVDDVAALWTEELDAFSEQRESYLLYRRTAQ